MDAVFIHGIPAKITVHDFRRHHLQSFPKLRGEDYDGLIADAIDTVYAIFPGVATIWDMHRDRQVWYDKTVLCYRLLTAWLIADRYAELAAGVRTIDGIRQKKVDGVSLTYDVERVRGEVAPGYPAVLAGLNSNHFGRTALMMVRSAGKNALLRVEKVV
jgi:hypothetical protein